MLDEVKKLIDDLNSFIYASFWNEADTRKKKRFEREVAKIKKMLIKERLL